MEINEEKILNLAKQIYMELDTNEMQELITDIQKEVNEVKIINEVDISNVNKFISVLEKSNSLRKDEIEVFEDVQKLLSNAKEVEDNMFVLPKIV